MQINSTVYSSSQKNFSFNNKPFSAKKSNVSFSGSTAVAKPAGKRILDAVVRFCDFTTSGSLSRVTFLSLATVLLLGGRYYQARNADEKREVATRDFSAVVAAVYAIPLFKKFAGNAMSKNGIPITYGKTEAGFLNKINPEKGVQIASYEQLAEWYSAKHVDDFKKMRFDDKHEGFVGFCKNIKEIGGDLMKCFTTLDKTAKEKLDKLGHGEVNNDNILGILEKAKDTDTVKNLKELFVCTEKNPHALLTKANHAKSWVEAGCILATAALLGWALPGFNIWYTRKKYKEGNKHNEIPQQQNIAAPAQQPQIAPVNSSDANMAEKFRKFHATGKLV
jgi:hypothetical protein